MVRAWLCVLAISKRILGDIAELRSGRWRCRVYEDHGGGAVLVQLFSLTSVLILFLDEHDELLKALWSNYRIGIIIMNIIFEGLK